MEIIDIVGFSLSMGIGIIMGLMGAGGSLIIPVLVYLLAKDTTLATGYALFLVGFTACIGAVSKIRNKEVSFDTALILVVPIILSTLFARIFLIHIIPEVLLSLGDIEIGRQAFIMLIYASIVLISGLSMIGVLKFGHLEAEGDEKSISKEWIFGIGIIIGLISGLVGAGGGVLIVPVMVLILRVPMKLAVGTTLTVIAIKSAIGFMGDVFMMKELIEWKFLISLSIVMILGILLGSSLSNKIPGQKLRGSFGWVMLAMCFFVVYKEFLVPIL